MICAFDAAKDLLRIDIVDTGRGIKQEEMSKLFTLFGKLLRTADCNHEGIGMGLLICQNLVSMNDGTINVHSDGIEKGAVFSFTLKMYNVEQETMPETQI